MFLLDTNVLSALMRHEAAPAVAAWVVGQPEGLLFTAAVCQAEILAGIAVMPEGRRRRALGVAAHAMFVEDFEQRVLAGRPARNDRGFHDRRDRALAGRQRGHSQRRGFRAVRRGHR
jgi:predicted nucleic acid-binding protein